MKARRRGEAIPSSPCEWPTHRRSWRPSWPPRQPRVTARGSPLATLLALERPQAGWIAGARRPDWGLEPPLERQGRPLCSKSAASTRHKDLSTTGRGSSSVLTSFGATDASSVCASATEIHNSRLEEPMCHSLRFERSPSATSVRAVATTAPCQREAEKSRPPFGLSTGERIGAPAFHTPGSLVVLG